MKHPRSSDRKRVVALHCKGGKGRTGTMICAVLIDMGLFSDAHDSLQYFGQRRTDLNVSNQFQGVETYSQVIKGNIKLTRITTSSDTICSLLSNFERTANSRYS